MSERKFEKQTLDNLLNDLKDIDKYTSFKNGVFIYDLGKYQATLLVNYINNLEEKIDAIKTELKQIINEIKHNPRTNAETRDKYIIEKLNNILGDKESRGE